MPMTLLKEISVDGGTTYQHIAAPPGPNVPSTTNPMFRYTLTNTGTNTITGITVHDSVFGNIATGVTLNSGGVEVFFHTGTWAAGAHANTATATGTENGQPVNVSDSSFYFGTAPTITVQKQVSPDNGLTWFDADTPPGPNVIQGNSPLYRFIVTNSGNVTLTLVSVTDSVLGQISVGGTLTPGGVAEFTEEGAWAPGLQTNTATASGTFDSETVTDTDEANYTGVTAGIDIVKEISVDGGTTWTHQPTPPGPNVLSGTNPMFRYTVTNTGDVALSVDVTDSAYGTITTGFALAAGASQQFFHTGTWSAGEHTNTATATATVNGVTVTDTDVSHFFGAMPEIHIFKEVSPDNGLTWFDAENPPGPDVVQGVTPQFRFTVTNEGNVAIQNVEVTDSILGLINPTPFTLPIGGSDQFIEAGTWAEGQQMNTATATGTVNGTTVTGTYVAHYVGVTAEITVLKEVSPDSGVTWFDANTPPGPQIVSPTNPEYRFTVTNTGTATLQNVSVTDSHLGVVLSGLTLTPGEFEQVVRTGVLAAGQQTNTATATGTADGITASDTDVSNYFGLSQAVLTLQKQVSPDNGLTWFDADIPPGPEVPQGTNPMFRYIVTNEGIETLTDITITDNVLGPIASGITLLPGDSDDTDVTGTWEEGEQVNTGTATGEANDQTFTATNTAHYVGAVPALTLLKEISPDGGLTWLHVTGPPGPTIVEVMSPEFRYTVTNTGTATLPNVDITDTVLGTIASGFSLNPGEERQFIETGTWMLGEQMNTATATATVFEHTVTASDSSWYLGEAAAPAFTLQKLVSFDQGVTFVPAGSAPGPTVLQGINPIFRYIITDTGNTPLFNIGLFDTVLGTIALPTTNLLPGQNITVDEVGTWQQGLQENIAEATAQFDGETFEQVAEAFFFGQISAVPIFPDISNPPPQADIIDRLLETIALEELALSALINAEAEKIQAAVAAGVSGPVDAEDVTAVNVSVEEVMRKVVAKERALYRKLERILRHKETGV